MDYTKQLIKAISDLTKAVDRNTKAVKESFDDFDLSKIDQLSPNDIKEGTPDDLNNSYKKGFGGMIHANSNVGKDEIIIANNEVVLTPEMQKELLRSLNCESKLVSDSIDKIKSVINKIAFNLNK